MKTATRHLALVATLAVAAFGVQAQTQTLPQTQPPTATPAPDGKATEALTAAFKRADANQDGKLSREESARIPAVADNFDSYDKDKDGTLSLEELSSGMPTAK